VLAKDTATLRKTLDLSSFGLLEAVRQAKLEPSETLLVVVDQFEELFRFDRDRAGDGGAEAQLFAASLLEASSAFSPAVYVVLTMRSDFLGGDCAQFSGLPEALNQSQYLIPRLTREQRREAIEKPLALVGARMKLSLVQRLDMQPFRNLSYRRSERSVDYRTCLTSVGHDHSGHHSGAPDYGNQKRPSTFPFGRTVE
jgi:hypothetical protein